MALDMVAGILTNRRKNNKKFPCHSNRASAIGDDCLRYLVYSRTDWDKSDDFDDGLLAIFNEGNIHEPAVIKDLADAGFEIFEQQVSFGNENLLKQYKITGHLDFKIRDQGRAIPVEFKTMSPYIFDSINSL